MILRKQEEVEAHGINETKEFQIKASSHAFRILSDGLYSDKISSIIRELSCNALDSHIERGNPQTPFQIHIPTKTLPHFHIRDYGIGLSEEDVKGLYSTYFASTKGQSNDFVGALGLGSKSPFSYTDSFTVESWFNGMKKTYAVFIGEQGVPNISKIYEEENSEETGLKISFEVKEDDVNAFTYKAKLLAEFDVIPDLNISLPEKGETLYKGNNCEVRKINFWNTVYYAKQGPILYKIDSKNLPEKFPRLKNSLMVILTFDMGEISFTASREEISFDEDTTSKIELRFLELAKDIIIKQKEEIDVLVKDKCIVKQYEDIDKYISEQTILYDIKQKDYYKKLLVTYPEREDEVAVRTAKTFATDYDYLQYKLKFDDYQYFYIKHYKHLSKSTPGRLSLYSTYLELDIKSHRESIKKYLKDNKIKRVYISTPDQIKKLKDLNIIDDSYVVKMSDIRIRKERVKYKRGVYIPTDNREYVYRWIDAKSDYINEGKITKNNLQGLEGFYIEVHHLENLERIISLLSMIGKNIYILNKTLTSSNHNLQPLIPYLKTPKIKKIANNMVISTELYFNNVYDCSRLINKSEYTRKIYNKMFPGFKQYEVKSYNLSKINLIALVDDKNYFKKFDEIIDDINTTDFHKFMEFFPLADILHIEESELYIKAKVQILKKQGEI